MGKKYGGSIRYAVEYHEEKKIADPDPLGSNPSSAQRMIYNEEIKEIFKEKRNMKKDLEKLYSVVWGQCTPAMKTKLRATKNYKENKKKLKSMELLKEIKNISYNFQDKLESIFLTAVIEAKERRNIMTLDIPNAFIQTKVENEEDKVIMRIRGRLAEYMEMIAPEIYSPFIVLEKGKKVLYCEVQNAIYGTLKVALLFYKKSQKDLEDIGFGFNQYDACVANRYIDGNQQTVVFHVEDLKVSCVIEEENKN